MPPNTLLMCKLLLLLLLIHGFFLKIDDPYLPFFLPLDEFRRAPGLFRSVLQFVFCAAGACLILNVRVRAASVALGVTVLLFVLSAKPEYRNHIFIVGCLFFLAGLHRRDENAWLIKWQFCVMYLGAFLNKLLDPDWRTGQFIEGWLHGHLENPFYEVLRPLLPELGVAKLISWGVIVSELVLVILFAVPRLRNLGVWMAILVHVGFVLVVGRRPFGHFTEDILIALLVYLSWPANPMSVSVGARLAHLMPMLKLMNWDGQFQFTVGPRLSGGWFVMESQGRTWTNLRGLARFLKYNSAFYVGLFFTFNGLAYLISRYPFK